MKGRKSKKEIKYIKKKGKEKIRKGKQESKKT